MEVEEGLVGVKAEVRDEVVVDWGWDWGFEVEVEDEAAGWRLGAIVSVRWKRKAEIWCSWLEGS